MESHTLLKRWGQIVIPLVILTDTCIPGLESDKCNGICGYGTSCVEGKYCRCKAGFDILLAAKGNFLAFCLRTCGSGDDVCPANTTCLMRNVLGASRNLCDCSDGARRSATAQCLDIDECTEYPGVCGNNSVCTNTDGNYTCACEEGYRQIDGLEVRCILATDSSALAIGLTVCGMFLLNIIILVVVVLRRQNRPREYESEDVSFKMEEKRSCVTRPAYEDVTGQSVQQKLGVSNLTCPESVILPEESSVTSMDDRYEDVNLPSQPELYNLI